MNQVFTINTEICGHKLTFLTTYGLFSYKEIDGGTRLLCEHLPILKEPHSCLDLGCGYGPVGIIYAKMNPQAQVFFVDRDFVAIEYAQKNCELNRIVHYKTQLSDGFRHLSGITFDLIVSHLPTHVSHEMLRQVIMDSKNHLRKDGRMYIVTVSKLNRFLESELRAVFDNYTKVASDNLYTVARVIKV